MSKSARIPRSSRPDKRPGLSRIPAVVIMLSAAFLLAVLGIFWGLSFTSRPPDVVQEDWSRRKHHHKPKSVMSSQVRQLASLVDFHRLWNTFLMPMLIERYPGSEGIQLVRQHIQDQVESLPAGWSLEMDTFEERTPHGVRTFTNLVATLAPTARRRLVLACHYDSKYYPPDGAGRVYVGATDSAVPCAILLEIMHALDKELLRLKERAPDLTLQLLFLDGEEALVSWTATDSLYGSRHLAERMVKTRHPHTSSSTTLIDSLDLFVLLDLLGVSKPTFLNHFSNTAHWFNRLVGIERRLHRLGLLTHHPVEVTYFAGDTRYAPIEDDHLPFLRKGVPILHLISTPFPWVWHTMDDSVENLHPPTIENLVKIVTIFVAEYLGL